MLKPSETRMSSTLSNPSPVEQYARIHNLDPKELEEVMRQTHEAVNGNMEEQVIEVENSVENSERRPKNWKNASPPIRVIRVTCDPQGNPLPGTERFWKLFKVSVHGTSGETGKIQYAGIYFRSASPGEDFTSEIEEQQKELLEQRWLEGRITLNIPKIERRNKNGDIIETRGGLPRDLGSNKQLMSIEHHWFLRSGVRKNSISRHMEALGVPSSEASRVREIINDSCFREPSPIQEGAKNTILGMVMFASRERGMHHNSPQHKLYENSKSIAQKRIDSCSSEEANAKRDEREKRKLRKLKQALAELSDEEDEN